MSRFWNLHVEGNLNGLAVPSRGWVRIVEGHDTELFQTEHGSQTVQGGRGLGLQHYAREADDQHKWMIIVMSSMWQRLIDTTVLTMTGTYTTYS